MEEGGEGNMDISKQSVAVSRHHALVGYASVGAKANGSDPRPGH